MSNTVEVGQLVRSRSDGQLGYVIERTTEDGGGLGVQLDRKQQKIVFPYDPHRWEAVQRNPLTPIQLARIAYSADQALRTSRGEYGVKGWIEIQDEARIGWTKGPPPTADNERQRLYQAIKGAFSEEDSAAGKLAALEADLASAQEQIVALGAELERLETAAVPFDAARLEFEHK